MTILCLTRSRAWFSRFLNTWAAARPSLRAVSAVTGSTLAVPRTPSVPKIFLGVIHLPLRRISRLKRNLVRHDLFQRDLARDNYFHRKETVKLRQIGYSDVNLNILRA